MEPTQDQIQAWKARYGEGRVKLAKVLMKPAKRDGNGKELEPAQYAKYVIRVPGRAEINAIGRHGNKGDVEKVNDVFVKNCVLFGDMDLLDADGTVYASLLDKFKTLMHKREVELEEL